MNKPTELRKLRLLAGATLEQVAKAAQIQDGGGCSPATISNIERGMRPIPARIIKAMVMVYGVSVKAIEAAADG